MSLEPEMVKILLSDPNETEYSVDFRERYGTAPVFDRLLLLQLEYAGKIVKEEELVETWNEAQGHISQLETEASEQGLLGRVATLSGDGLEIPKFETDLSVSVSQIVIPDNSSVTDKTLERYYHADTATGIFSGFTLRFEKAGEKQYVPRFAYQVSTTIVDVPNAHINLYATGLAGQTELKFEDDEKLDTIAPILEKLYLLCGDKFSSVNLINMALAKAETHDASCLRHVAYHAEKLIGIVESEVATEVEDGIIELIAHYIGDKDKVVIKSPAFVLSGLGDEQPTEYYDGDELYSLRGESIGLAFFDRFHIKDGEVKQKQGRMLNLVLAHQKRNICIPLIRIEEYSKE